MNNPKVSVVIPVYNTEAYVEQTLRSIMGQTLRDIELIVINDGSTDGSLSVLERIATGDDRIRLYTQPNKGLSETRNAGIDRARGGFIYFMDSDDLLGRDALRHCHEECERHKLTSLSSMPKPSWKTATRRTSTITAEKASWMKTSCGTASNCWTSR